MAKIAVEGIGKFYHHYPRVAVIVTARSEGKSNAMAVAWHSAISVNPPLYGIAITPQKFTYKLIIESNEFGINFVPFQIAELVAAVGGSTGAKTDKFNIFDIVQDKPLKTSLPILQDAYATYECKLVEHRNYGDHEWLVGEIVATQIIEDAFTPEQVIDINKVEPVLYLGADLYLSPAKGTIRSLNRQVYGRQK